MDKKGVKRFVGNKEDLKHSGCHTQYPKHVPLHLLLGSQYMIGVSRKPDHLLPRSYSRAFGKKILQLWEEERSSKQPRLCMRQKVKVRADLTDHDLFRSLPLGDTWPDAELVSLWSYLMVPSGWQATMDEFNTEVLETVPWLT